MQDSIITTFKRGLVGKGIHLDSRKAIKGLTPLIARKKPHNDVHSCWELLHHIVVWQDAIIKAIKGKDVDWDSIGKNNNWPSAEMLKQDLNFNNLVVKFDKGIEKVEKLIEKVKFSDPMPGWENHPVFEGISVLLQHNSYHIGQMVVVRKLLGEQPSSDNFF